MLHYFIDKHGPKTYRERRAIRTQTQNAVNFFVFIRTERAMPTIERVKNLDLSQKSSRKKVHQKISDLLEQGDFDENNTVPIQQFIIQKIEEGLKQEHYNALQDCSLAVISMLNSINHILLLYETRYRDSTLLTNMVRLLVSRTPEGIAVLYPDGLPEDIAAHWPYVKNMLDAV